MRQLDRVLAVTGVHVKLGLLVPDLALELNGLPGCVIKELLPECGVIPVLGSLHEEWDSHEHVVDPGSVFLGGQTREDA